MTIDPSAAAERGSPATRDVTTLTVGGPVSGELDGGDPTFEAGEYHDTYVFDGDEGETVRIELSSADFDTYLGLVTPSGEEIANDDFEGDTDRSVIELTLPEAGRYRVQATSYAAAETGRYRLALTASTADVPVERRSQGRVYGLFAGISDYQPPNTDLQYTAEDATRIRDALDRRRRHARRRRVHVRRQRRDDRQHHARPSATSRAAWAPTTRSSCSIRATAAKCRAATARRPAIPTPWTKRWPCTTARCSTTSCARCSTRSTRERCSLWLDSCFSGGFAKDIVSAPGRMGIFSSEEDITSNVASKFRAGGYLSLFLDEAIAQGLADDDKDNSITAIELSQYLHERYRADVKSTRSADVVRNEMTLGYQHLVVDRGSIGAYDVLFER